MALDEILVDSEDLSFDLLPELERSFGIKFDRNLRHVQTAGELFDEMLRQRQPLEAGDRCDTAMTFFLLRRALAEQGLDPRASPSTPLGRHGLPSAREVKARLAQETGLELPPLTVSAWGCALVSGVAVVALALFMFNWMAAVAVALIGVTIVSRLDRGSWAGEWMTLGSLARAMAARNVVQLGDRGARSRRSDWWRAYTELLAGYAFVGKRPVSREEIGTQTRFRFG